MSDRAAQARAEAERRYPEGWDHYNDEPVDDWGEAVYQREGFTAGVAWADYNPQPRTITRAEFEEAYTYWFDGLPSRGETIEFLSELGIEVTDE